MECALVGNAADRERFCRYMASNPAASRGWVTLEGSDAVGVSQDYLESFREIAANFGLEVFPVDDQAVWE